MALIAPSILASDFSTLGDTITMLDRSEADYIHIDVMDGRFVPNISFGMPIIKSVRHLSQKTFDVHLMIVEPEKYAADFKNAGADILTVHAEVCPHLHRNIQQIHSLDMKAGVALNPHTPISILENVIQDIDLVCMMSVNPGFGGQKFITQALSKVTELKKMIKDTGSNAKIEIDGGVTLENAKEVIAAGTDVLVAGSSVFKTENPTETIAQLKKIS